MTMLGLLAVVAAAAVSPPMVERYSRTRTLPKKMPLPTPYPEISPPFSFTFAVEELPDEYCPPCPKCNECPPCGQCRSCPPCPPTPRCAVCVACPTPCPPCTSCPPCPDGKVSASVETNGQSNRVLFFEMV